MGLTEAEVARRAGVSSERVRALVEAGVLRPGDDPNAPFRNGDALRVRLADELEASGIAPERVGEAIAAGTLTLTYLDRFPDPPLRSSRTFGDVCGELGLPFTLVERIYASFGLARPEQQEHAREDDLAVLSRLPILFRSGLGEGEVLRAARVWGDGVRRIAHHQVYSFHELIEEPFRKRGLSDSEVLDAALTEVGVELIPYVHQLIAWLYARHFESHAIAHRVSHVETALHTAGLQPRSVDRPEAAVFADLTGSTRLTEELGDEAASELALRLAELMQEVADRHGGLVVKMLGDGVHFHFRDPAAAVLASLDFVDAVEPAGLPPAHVGANAGPINYTDGDYYGLTVIVAARLAARARPGEVLVGEAIAARRQPEGVRFEDLGPVTLKGVAEPLKVFRALRA
jgi:adenylate cyclase